MKRDAYSLPRVGGFVSVARNALLSGALTFLAISGFGANAATAQAIALEVANATLAYDARTNEPLITFRLAEKSQHVFGELTSQNVGKVLEFRIDGRVMMRPVIREPIHGGTGQIAARFSKSEAQELATRLSSGTARLEVEAMPR